MSAPDEAPATRVEVVGRLDADEVRAVSALAEAATEEDGVGPLSEHVMLHLRYGGDEPARNIMLYAESPGGGQELVAYGHLDVTDPVEGASAEVVVHPARRRAGIGGRLVEAVLAETTDGRLRLWSHGEHPAAAALAHSLGFRAARALWQMRRSLGAPLPEPKVPAGVSVRAFAPGRDEEPWVALNARAFRDHPEQGTWTSGTLHRRMQEPWFDADGFFVAEREGRLVGFHWTKVHGASGHGHDPIGEVYVVGVDPPEQGTGLGKALTLIGLRHLRQQGLPTAMLYVEADNTAAIRLYSGLGFTRWETDVLFSNVAAAVPG